MKILYFQPRDDDEPPTRGRRSRRDPAGESEQAGQVIVLDVFAGNRTLPQAA
jgi:hypothetical protein